VGGNPPGNYTYLWSNAQTQPSPYLTQPCSTPNLVGCTNGRLNGALG
jgi:hypothetical protein